MPQVDVMARGVLEMNAKGFGFLRDPSRHYVAQPSDTYVPAAIISKLRLAEGLHLTGRIEPSRKGAGPRMSQLETIEGPRARTLTSVGLSTT